MRIYHMTCMHFDTQWKPLGNLLVTWLIFRNLHIEIKWTTAYTTDKSTHSFINFNMNTRWRSNFKHLLIVFLSVYTPLFSFFVVSGTPDKQLKLAFDNYVKAIYYVPVAIVTNYRLLKMYEFKIRHINISVHPSLYTEWILNLKLLNWRTPIFLKCVSSYLKTD